MKRTFFFLLILLLYISCDERPVINGETLNPEWYQTFPGVWKSKINQPEEFNLLSVTNKPPRSETLKKKSQSEFPISTEEIRAFTKNGKTFLRFPLEREEQIYGFGLNFK